MAITIQGNKPVELQPLTKDKLSKDFDAMTSLKEVMVYPILTELIPGHPVTVQKDGMQITEDDIATGIADACDENANVQTVDDMKMLYAQSLISYPRNSQLSFQRLFAVQAGKKANLPEPSPMVVYTPAQDIIPICRQFLGAQVDYNTLFATFAYYASPDTLGVYFANATAFDDFKAYLANTLTTIQTTLPTDTLQCMNAMQNMTLNELTESLVLRNSDSDGLTPYAFPRVLQSLLMNYSLQTPETQFGILPFHVGELILPKTMVFINIEEHARASASKIAQEWKIISNSLNQPLPMVSLNKLNSLTAMQRNIQKIQGQAATAAQASLINGTIRTANMPFKATRPNMIDVYPILMRILRKMETVNKSMNSYKMVKSSFARANRRNPDDYNKLGKIVSTRYKPDLHLYIDTSGSISESDYREAVRLAIAMAKKLNVDLYFNSFSHILSQCAQLHTKDKNPQAIMREFQKIPKVSGGTDFTLVWDYIMRSKKRQRELSIMITDFEFSAPNKHIDHPKNLYYLPCATMNWSHIRREAEHFVKSAQMNIPDIRNHLLF